MREEVIGARCYTGPLYEKYNSVLRFFTGPDYHGSRDAVPFLQRRCEQLGLGEYIQLVTYNL